MSQIRLQVPTIMNRLPGSAIFERGDYAGRGANGDCRHATLCHVRISDTRTVSQTPITRSEFARRAGKGCMIAAMNVGQSIIPVRKS